jgi:hypothetical protein
MRPTSASPVVGNILSLPNTTSKLPIFALTFVPMQLTHPVQ